MTDTSKEAVERLANECLRVSLIGGADRGWIADTLRALLAERDNFRAVLEGAEYRDIEWIANTTQSAAFAIGAEVKNRTMDIILERDALADSHHPN